MPIYLCELYPIKQLNPKMSAQALQAAANSLEENTYTSKACKPTLSINQDGLIETLLNISHTPQTHKRAYQLVAPQHDTETQILPSSSSELSNHLPLNNTTTAEKNTNTQPTRSLIPANSTDFDINRGADTHSACYSPTLDLSGLPSDYANFEDPFNLFPILEDLQTNQPNTSCQIHEESSYPIKITLPPPTHNFSNSPPYDANFEDQFNLFPILENLQTNQPNTSCQIHEKSSYPIKITDSSPTHNLSNPPSYEASLGDQFTLFPILEDLQTNQPNTFCQICEESSHPIKVIGLFITQIRENTYAYSLQMLHLQSINEWLKHSHLIQTHLSEDPMALLAYLLISLRETHEKDYIQELGQTNHINSPNFYEARQLVYILSIYLYYGLLEKYKQIPHAYTEAVGLQELLSQPEFKHIFALIIGLNKHYQVSEQLESSETFQTLETTQNQPCLKKLNTSPPPTNPFTQTLLPKRLTIATTIGTNLNFQEGKHPIQNCPSALNQPITIPTTKITIEAFYKAIEPLEQCMQNCQQTHRTHHSSYPNTLHKASHKLYLHFTYNNKGVIKATNESKITISVAEVNSFSEHWLFRKQKIVTYKSIYDSLRLLQNNTLPNQQPVVDYNYLNSYIQQLPMEERIKIEEQLKIQEGVTLANSMIANTKSFERKEKKGTLNLYDCTRSLRFNSKVAYLLKLAHFMLNTPEGSTLTIPKIDDTSTEANSQQYTISEIACSSSIFTKKNHSKISGYDLFNALNLLIEEASPSLASKASDNTIYALCLPFSITTLSSNEKHINLSTSRLKIVSLDSSFIKQWNNLYHSKLHMAPSKLNPTQLTPTQLIPSIIEFLIPEEYSLLPNNYNNEAMNAFIAKHKAKLKCILENITGIQLAQLLCRSVMTPSPSSIRSHSYFNEKLLEIISKALVENNLASIIECGIKKSITTTKADELLNTGLGNRIITHFMENWKLPTAAYIEGITAELKEKKEESKKKSATNKQNILIAIEKETSELTTHL